MTDECYLHVDGEGEEHRYPSPPPNLPSLHVWVPGDGWEYTATYRYGLVSSWMPPRGAGWKYVARVPALPGLDTKTPSFFWKRKVARA